MDKLQTDKYSLKQFGMIMGFAFLCLSGIIFWKEKQFSNPALSLVLLFFIPALAAPLFLKPIYILWMRLAFVLSWVNTRIILSLIFYLVFAPVGLLLRLLRKDLLDRRFQKDKQTYWSKKQKLPFAASNYERRF